MRVSMPLTTLVYSLIIFALGLTLGFACVIDVEESRGMVAFFVLVLTILAIAGLLFLLSRDEL
jgi:hypothetical protein